MLAQTKNKNPKQFFGETFSLNLTFHSNGGIVGKFTTSQLVPMKLLEVTGMYVTESDITLLYLSGDFGDPNSDFITSTHFYGEIGKYSMHKEGLFIKWLSITNTPISKVVDEGIELLFDRPGIDIANESIKLKHFLKNVAMSIN